MISTFCKKCGKEIKTYPSRLKEGKGLFCSKRHFYEFSKGRKPWNTGKKCISLSLSKKGNKNPMWKGGYDKKKSDREYGARNRKKIMEKQKIWNLKNIKKVRAAKAKWQNNNPEQRAIIWNRRRVREIDFGGNITREEWKEVKHRQNNKCLHCFQETKLTIDHIVPVFKWKEWAEINKPKYKCGDKENIQALCKPCNSKKGAKLSTQKSRS